MELIRVTWSVSPRHPFWIPRWEQEDFFPPPGLLYHWLCKAARQPVDPATLRYGIIHLPFVSATVANFFWYLTNLSLLPILRRLVDTVPAGSLRLCRCPVRLPTPILHTLLDFPNIHLDAPVVSLPVISNHAHTTFRSFYLIRSPRLIDRYFPVDPEFHWGIPLHDFTASPTS